MWRHILTLTCLTTLFSSSYALIPLCSGKGNQFQCQVEVSNAILDTKPTKNVLHFAEYNIDRNGKGGDGKKEAGLIPLINIFKTNPDLKKADVIFLIEVSRGCKASNYVNDAAEFAKALHMNWAYGVEYRVNNDNHIGSECTIGNAILSKYPLNDVNTRFFDAQNENTKYGNRSGGRQFIVAKINKTKINHNKNLAVIATHLDSGTSAKDFIKSVGIREQQANEVTQYAYDHFTNDAVIVGGDMNTPNIPLINSAIKSFSKAQFDNPFYYSSGDKTSAPDSPIAEALKVDGYHIVNFQLDYIFAKAAHMITNYTKIYNHDANILGISDHVPISAALVLQPKHLG